MSKPYFEWHGGPCPVAAGTLLDVQFRNGMEKLSIPALMPDGTLEGPDAQTFYWNHDAHRFDIIAWRLHQPEQAAWSGEGVPPEGIYCEVKSGKDLWVHCQIVHSSYAGVAFIYLEEPGNGVASKWIGNIDCVSIRAAKDYFRPIRTEEERKRDGFIDHLMADWLFLGHDREQAGSLYDAIASGKIPGVKIE